MKKLLVGILVMALLIVSCTKNTSDAKLEKEDNEEIAPVIKIGVSLPTQREEGWVRAKEAFEKFALENADVEINLQIADTDVAMQNKQVSNMITAGVDVIILAPADSAAVSAVVDEAFASNIPVIAYDRLITGTANLAGYMSYDNVKIGELQGNYLKENAPKGNYIILSGAPTDNNSKLFKQGAMDVLSPLIEANDINILADQAVENWDPINAKKIVANVLTVSPDIQAILAPNDNTAGGAISALEDQGISGVVITGCDAQVDAIKRINNGTQDMTVFKDNKNLAVAACELAVQMAKGQAPAAPATINNGSSDIPYYSYTPLVITKDNIDVLIKSGYLVKEQIEN